LVDFQDYLRPLYRRRWVAGTAFSVTLVLALLYAFTAEPVYRAQVRLLIEPEDPTVVTFREVVAQRGRLVQESSTTQRDMLLSRSLARATIDRLDLWDHPDFGGPGEETALSGVRRAARRGLSWVGSWIRPPPSSPEDGADGESRTQARAISALLARLQVTGGRNSRILRVRFQASEARVSADVVNTLTQLHVERDMEFRYRSSRQASQWLQERLAVQRQKLAASERALQDYREAHGAAGIEDRQTIIVRDLENLHAAATQATIARVESEVRYRDLEAIKDDAEALGRLPEVLRNEVIQQRRLTLAGLRRDRTRLAEELGPRHPDMISIESSVRDAEDRLRNEILGLVESLRLEFQLASSREQELLAQLDRQTVQALELDRTGIEYGVMRREAESDRELYDTLLQRAAETGVTSELETSNIRVLDRAEPPTRPVQGRRRLIALIGLFGGGLLGVGLAFTMDWMDDSIETPEQIKAEVAAPHLGMIPFAERRAADAGGRPRLTRRSPEPGLLLHTDVPAEFEEAIRAVRTSLVFASAAEGCRMVIVTSPGPGEGKSVIAVNLAVSLAQLGRRTLLVDTDFRRPQQHEHLGMDLEPGLSNALAGEAPIEAVIRPAGVSGLSVIPAGKAPPRPADLLGSERFQGLVASWRDRFDWIVCDAPPVLPVADTLVTAQQMKDALFVVESGRTSRRAAREALGRLDHAGVQVLGVVLNKTAVNRHPYYYAPYYHRSYGRYYRASATT
jgi:capsular exopolysaccharide synthesis family protein